MSFDKGHYSMGNLPSRQIAQRDLTSHSRLKLRRLRGSEETAEEKLKRLKRELEEREKKDTVPTETSAVSSSSSSSKGAEEASDKKKKADQNEFDDADADVGARSSESEDEEDVAVTAKSKAATDLALEKELQRVKMERQLKAQQESAANGLTSNPLLDPVPIQRRWDDDVIFRNQSKGEPSKRERRFVNDIVHSDTHKDFLKKHIL